MSGEWKTDRTKRHVLSLSGGKDSSALAIYLRDIVPDVEYVFCDTLKELPETYEYLERLEKFLGKPIVRLSFPGGFDALLNKWNGFLPSHRRRWCTRGLKIQVFEDYIGNDPCYLYLGVRVDESNRKGYKGLPHVIPVYPFIEDNLRKKDIERILQESGLGFPEYYRWRTRSGCFFCFYQRKIEWVGLLENHPDLFQKAVEYEKATNYRWRADISLEELVKQAEQIKENARQKELKLKQRGLQMSFLELIEEEEENDCESRCSICHL